MHKIMFYLRLLVVIVIGLVISFAGPGCSGSASTSNPLANIDVVREVFPSATEITEISSRSEESVVREIRSSSQLLGYSVETRVVGRSGPFIIAVLLDQRLIVKRATVVSYPWPRGRDVTRYSFTRQFEGKGPEDAIVIGKDIDAVTGATISCRAMALGVRKAIKLLDNDI